MAMGKGYQERFHELESALGEVFDQDIWSRLQEQNLVTNTQIADAFRKKPNFSEIYTRQQENQYQREKDEYIEEQMALLRGHYSDAKDCSALFKSLRLLYTSSDQNVDLDQKLAYITQYFEGNTSAFAMDAGV